ncbi:MAG TPA: serine/threonine-protein kinase [Gemmataceae bacterium]|nr:serine/threonine-protein kinase [Gemmataceae bacterium]
MSAPEPTINLANKPGDDVASHFGHAPLSARPIPLRLGPYAVLRPIGKGGMARVLLAEHTAMRRQVALKVLPDHAILDPATLERFYREARASAALDHPNIVRAFDVREAEGFHFLVMEYVPGEDLEAIVHQRGPLPPAEAVNYALQAASGLRHAHKQGLVHRDIKPSNLLVDRQGVVKILDLGLARFHKDGDRLTAELGDGAIMCTPDYVAPEQLDPDKVVDHRADIYSLGGTLYALLTGRPPFQGTTPQKLVAHQAREPVPVHEVRPDVPAELANIVDRMMAKDPAARYQTASEVIRALRVLEDPAAATLTSGELARLTRAGAETGRQQQTMPTAPALPPNWEEITSPWEDVDPAPNRLARQKEVSHAWDAMWQAIIGALIVLIVAGIAYGMNWMVRRGGKSTAEVQKGSGVVFNDSRPLLPTLDLSQHGMPSGQLALRGAWPAVLRQR